MILQYLQNSLTKIVCCFPLQKPSASCLPSQDPLTFSQDSGACTYLGHSLNLFSSTEYDRCVKHILCCSHWLDSSLQSLWWGSLWPSPHAAARSSWWDLCLWHVARGCQARLRQQRRAACGCRDEVSFCRRQRGIITHPKPGSELCSLVSCSLVVALCVSCLLCFHMGGLAYDGIQSCELPHSGLQLGPFPAVLLLIPPAALWSDQFGVFSSLSW